MPPAPTGKAPHPAPAPGLGSHGEGSRNADQGLLNPELYKDPWTFRVPILNSSPSQSSGGFGVPLSAGSRNPRGVCGNPNPSTVHPLTSGLGMAGACRSPSHRVVGSRAARWAWWALLAANKDTTAAWLLSAGQGWPVHLGCAPVVGSHPLWVQKDCRCGVEARVYRGAGVGPGGSRWPVEGQYGSRPHCKWFWVVWGGRWGADRKGT